jgi:hypothetical protein
MFEFSVKNYVRNTKTLLVTKIEFTSVIYKHYWKLEISGSHSGKYEVESHLGYSAA